MNNNKVVAIVIGAVVALFALSFVVRFVVLSEYGMSGSWMFFGLPFGGVGIVVLLLRLGLLNIGGATSRQARPLYYNIDAQTPTPAAPQPVGVSARLQELDGMRSAGAISESEYTARRAQIISAI